MSFLVLGFFTGLSLILAIGAQNIFVIEQGLKKQFVFIVYSVHATGSLSAGILIVLTNWKMMNLLCIPFLIIIILTTLRADILSKK